MSQHLISLVFQRKPSSTSFIIDLREEHVVFGPAKDRRPSPTSSSTYVEGEKVVTFHTMANMANELLSADVGTVVQCFRPKS